MSIKKLETPDKQTIDALMHYAEILAAYGPDSVEGRKFLEEHRHLREFEENAKQLYSLELEDWQKRRQSSMMAAPKA